MRAFAEFWTHDAPNLACCQFVDQDEIEADPDAYNCETCPVAAQLAEIQMDATAWAAWALFRQVVSRFTVEGHAVGTAFERLTQDLDPDDYAHALACCSMLFDVCHPPPEPKG